MTAALNEDLAQCLKEVEGAARRVQEAKTNLLNYEEAEKNGGQFDIAKVTENLAKGQNVFKATEKESMAKSHEKELAMLKTELNRLLKQAVNYLEVLKFSVKEEEADARVSTVVAAASQFKLDAETIEPGSAPIPLADLIVELREQLTQLKLTKEATEADLN